MTKSSRAFWGALKGGAVSGVPARLAGKPHGRVSESDSKQGQLQRLEILLVPRKEGAVTAKSVEFIECSVAFNGRTVPGAWTSRS